jgi:hypothetical protein
MAWDLTLRDIKKLTLNGIRFSSCNESVKQILENEVFPKRWQRFIDQVIELFDTDYLHY